MFSAKRGRLRNISLSGGFIETGSDARLLSRVHVAIEVPRRPGKDALVVPAYVARRTADGIGVEWCDFAPRAVAELIKDVAARASMEPDSGADPEDAPRTADVSVTRVAVKRAATPRAVHSDLE